ncbi:hypothetical protein PIROE2DRAFT_1492 [Piromyces sp. E2]|nr:hypothetical protein PIROE2DRAFT_1492 [Piromyces sp. E2]|eukprot:OUM70354.1 hypothetical protein PIROE2DRAFT_1492 [Piromyces sp. E2]
MNEITIYTEPRKFAYESYGYKPRVSFIEALDYYSTERYDRIYPGEKIRDIYDAPELNIGYAAIENDGLVMKEKFYMNWVKNQIFPMIIILVFIM